MIMANTRLFQGNMKYGNFCFGAKNNCLQRVVLVSQDNLNFTYNSSSANAANSTIEMQIFDLGGPEDIAGLRPLTYFRCSTVLLCFNVNRTKNFQAIATTFLQEVHSKCAQNVAYVLVGLRNDSKEIIFNEKFVKEHQSKQTAPITREQAVEFAKQTGCFTYVETSALKNLNCDKVFHAAFAAHYEQQFGLKGNITVAKSATSSGGNSSNNKSCSVQ